MWAQVKAAQAWIAVALLAASFACGLFLGGKWQKANGASRAVTLMADQLAEVRAEQAEDRKRAEKLQKTLDKLPRSQGKVRDAVRQAPSNCVLPPAVADSLREAIDQANAARALPAHP